MRTSILWQTLCLSCVLVLSLIWIGHSRNSFQLRSLIYDDSPIRRYLDSRLSYLKTYDENEQQVGYKSIRDYFDLGPALRPDDEYKASKNIENYLFGELKAMAVVKGIFFTDDHWQYSSDIELKHSGGSQANRKQCEYDLNYLHSEIQRAEQNSSHLFVHGKREMEILRWIDTWGRPSSESQWGDIYWMGSFRGCKYARVPRRDNNEIEFNYCVAKLLAKDWPDQDEMTPRIVYFNGICLPRSCDTTMAREQKGLIRDILAYNYSPMQRQRFLYKSIHDVYCLPERLGDAPGDGQLSSDAAWLVLATSIWIVLIILASIVYFWLSYNSRGQLDTSNSSFLYKIVSCLAIQRNWHEFIHDKPRNPNIRVDLRVLSIIKFMACMMVVYAHSNEYYYWNHRASTMTLIEARRPFYKYLFWFFKSLDIFMIVSGILFSYNLLNKLNKSQLKSIVQPRYYLLLQAIRYLRIAPLLIYTLAVYKALFKHLSEGPFWDHATYEHAHRGRCRAVSWWRHLMWPIVFDFGSWTGDGYQNECMPSSWYMVTDMRMFLLVPFYFHLLYWNKTKRLLILSLTVLVSTLWSYAQLSLQDLYYFRQNFQYGGMELVTLSVSYFDTTYYSPIGRFYAVAIGLFAGIYLHQYSRGKLNQWPSYMKGPVIWLALCWQIYDLCIKSISADIKFRQTGQVPSEESMKWAMILGQRIDVLVIVILALRLTTDWSKSVMRNANFCYRLSRLSYCIYIIHTLIIHYLVSASQFSRLDSDPTQLMMFIASIITISFATALPVYLLFESPLALMLNLSLDRMKTTSSGINGSASVEPDDGTKLASTRQKSIEDVSEKKLN